MTRLIIAGSRDIKEGDAKRCIISGISLWYPLVTEIVSGTARGVDKYGEYIAAVSGLAIKRFPANWDLYGKAAGYKRNQQMAEYADALLAIWDGESKGTKHMIDIMKRTNKPTKVILAAQNKNKHYYTGQELDFTVLDELNEVFGG